MPGERYFAARDRLAEISGCIAGLVRETGLEVPGHDEAPELHRPILIAALGEVNAGKSTLLNAIAGAPLCPAGPLPLTDDVRVYRHGAVAEVENADHVVCSRPAEFLRNFELLDTPGTNVISKPQIAALGQLLERAELVLVVFTAENPWTAATWDAVGRLTDEELQRTVLVVQRIDLKQPQDVPIILGHMRDLCLKRVGRELPIFPVSAKCALEAKSGGTGMAEAWSASRFAALECHLTEHVCESLPRRQVLHDAWHHAARTLRRMDDRFDGLRRSMDDDAWFLSTLEHEVDSLRDGYVAEAGDAMGAALEHYREGADDVVRQLGSHLGFVRSLFRLFAGDATAGRVEAALAARLQEAGEVFARSDAARLITACHKHWESVRPRVVERMGFDPGASTLDGEGREGASGRFVERMGKSVPHALGNLRVRGVLDPLLRRRNATLKGFTTVALLVIIAAGVCGGLGMLETGLLLIAVAVGVLLAAAVFAWVSRASVTSSYRERLHDSSQAFVDGLRPDHGEAIRTLFRDYSGSLIEVRRKLANRKAALQPQLARWNELFIALKAVELEM